MKKIIILVIVLISAGGFVFYSQSKQEKPKLEQVNVSEKKAEEKVADNLQSKESESEKNLEDKVQEPKQEEKVIEQTPKQNEKQQVAEQKEVSKQNNQNVSSTKEIASNNTPTPEVTKPEPVIEAKKEEVWDKLGMTKDEYYNKPMFSWERVDFKTMNECLSYGDNYEPYINGEVLYNCRDVLSASGKYLGVMFDTEKTN